MFSILLLSLTTNAKLFGTSYENGKVYRLGSDNGPIELLTDVTEPRYVAVDEESKYIYVCEGTQIAQYEMRSVDEVKKDNRRVIFEGLTPNGLTIDSWGHLYFSDGAANMIGAIYFDHLDNFDTKAAVPPYSVLYSGIRTTTVSSPTCITLDDFYENLYWGNGQDAYSYGYIQMAAKEPFEGHNDAFFSWKSTKISEIDAIAVTEDYLYFTSKGKLYYTYKYTNEIPKQIPISSTYLQALSLNPKKNEIVVADIESGGIYAFKEKEFDDIKILQLDAPKMSSLFYAWNGAGHLELGILAFLVIALL